MKADWFKLVLIGSLAMFLAACSQDAASTQPDKRLSPPAAPNPEVNPAVEPAATWPAQEPEEAGTPTTQPAGLLLPSGMEHQIEKARQDLAQRLKIPVESVTIDAVLGQEFSAEAFNCQTAKERISRDPGPDTISGFSILLRASGYRYEYHASGQTVFFCRPMP